MEDSPIHVNTDVRQLQWFAQQSGERCWHGWNLYSNGDVPHCIALKHPIALREFEEAKRRRLIE